MNCSFITKYCSTVVITFMFVTFFATYCINAKIGIQNLCISKTNLNKLIYFLYLKPGTCVLIKIDLLLYDNGITRKSHNQGLITKEHITTCRNLNFNSTVEPVNPDPRKYGHLYKTTSYVWPQISFYYSTYIDNLEVWTPTKSIFQKMHIFILAMLHLHKFSFLYGHQ